MRPLQQKNCIEGDGSRGAHSEKKKNRNGKILFPEKIRITFRLWNHMFLLSHYIVTPLIIGIIKSKAIVLWVTFQQG